MFGRSLRRVHQIVASQFGLDPLRMCRSLAALPRYVRNLARFRRDYRGPLELTPRLNDWFEAGGDATGEYFLQDLYVARKVYDAKPEKHVDIGSRVDGLVAHIASFREIEVFDIRPISATVARSEDRRVGEECRSRW